MFRYLVITVVAFVVGFGSAWLSFKSQEKVVVAVDENENRIETSVEVPNDGVEDSANVSPVLTGVVALSVENQAPGKNVFVREISVERAVWVVIVEDNAGVRGNILGAGLFDKGETAGLVQLLRGTVEGGSYFATLHAEDSNLTENRVFNLEKDTPLVGADGLVIEIQFETSSIPE